VKNCIDTDLLHVDRKVTDKDRPHADQKATDKDHLHAMVIAPDVLPKDAMVTDKGRLLVDRKETDRNATEIARHALNGQMAKFESFRFAFAGKRECLIGSRNTLSSTLSMSAGTDRRSSSGVKSLGLFFCAVSMMLCMNITLRLYEPSDLADVLSAWENATRIAHPFMTENFLDQERHNIPELYLPNAETWVVEKNSHVIGFLALIGNEVGAVFVDPKYQGQGIGTLLLDKACELRGDLEVEVFAENLIGRPFYEKYGFVPLSESIHKETGKQLLRLHYSQQTVD